MSSAFLGMPTAPRDVGHLRGSEPFPIAARRALADAQLRRNLGKATATIRAKRARVVAELGDWEQLRDAGRAIKARTLGWRARVRLGLPGPDRRDSVPAAHRC